MTRPRGLHGHLLDTLGTALTSGEYPAGTVLRIDELTAAHTVSRTVAREAIRVLETLGMVQSRPKVGVTVRPQETWNVFDPLLIRWRLAGRQRGRQLNQLAQLRAAVEPAAAALAARTATPQQRERLREIADEMAGATSIAEFVTADIEFHRLVLTSSGNDMFAHLAHVTAEVLRGRVEQHLMPDRPDPTALSRHVAVADAIARGAAAEAEHVLRTLVLAASEEVDRMLG